MAIKALIADDHQLFREGLIKLLSNSPEIIIIGEADNGEQAIEKALELNPDVIMMDIGMPGLNGIEATRFLKKKKPGIKIIALSMHSDKQYVKGMLEAGASGYLLKNSTHKQVLEAITKVFQGKKYLSAAITDALIDNYLGKDQQAIIDETGLTGREFQILKLFAEGHSTSEIAEMIFVSPKTVGTHKQNIRDKLKLKSTTDMVKYAIKHNIIDL